MVRHPLFASIASVVVEFETRTKSLYGDPSEGQYANIKALLGMTDIDMDCVLAAADTYIDDDQVEFSHDLRSMFALGFVMAVYAVKHPAKQDVYH